MPQRDPSKERYWRRWLHLWQQSGLTARDFCVAHRVPESSFYAWRRELARRDGRAARTRPPLPARPVVPAPSSRTAGPAFVQLAIDAGVAVPPAIEVVVAGRRVLRVRPGFDADLLRQLVHLLEEPSC
jgi:hypothetical protein